MHKILIIMLLMACACSGPDTLPSALYVAVSGAHLRAEPHTSSRSLRVIPAGEAVQVLARGTTRETQSLAQGPVTDVWYQVKDAGGQTGWVFGGCLAQVTQMQLREALWTGSKLSREEGQPCPYPAETDCWIITMAFLPDSRVIASWFCIGNDEEYHYGTYTLHDSLITIRFQDLKVAEPMEETGEAIYTERLPHAPVSLVVRTCGAEKQPYLVMLGEQESLLQQEQREDRNKGAFLARLRKKGILKLLGAE